MFSWRFVPTGWHMDHAGLCVATMGVGGEGEHLDVTCRDCGYQLGMRTADA